MSPQTQSSASLPIKDLGHFLKETQSLIDDIVYNWSSLLFPEKYRAPLLEAWDELKDTNVISDQFTPLSKPLGALEDSLKAVGLTGKQLTLKLKILSDAWETFKKKGGIGYLKYLLDWINKILDSLIAAIPTLEPLKEIKELIEGLMEPIDTEEAPQEGN